MGKWFGVFEKKTKLKIYIPLSTDGKSTGRVYDLSQIFLEEGQEGG